MVRQVVFQAMLSGGSIPPRCAKFQMGDAPGRRNALQAILGGIDTHILHHFIVP